ncbi:hypothetical protein C0J52_22130 [Blattella germanica]|nr:hypothetical protein C0J52_22130 [Blattella germanica]
MDVGRARGERANSRWAYRATMWDPRNGRRATGRPKIRWADSLVKNYGRGLRGIGATGRFYGKIKKK